MDIKQLIDNLWQQYIVESPDSLKIHDLLKIKGGDFSNDHIALRTFDHEKINIARLGKFFEQLGYEARGEYQFPLKKLFAKHYEHKNDDALPKIFISELITSQFSPFLQKQVKLCVDSIPASLLNNAALLYSGQLWGELDYDIYQKLLVESEYAAWLYVFGFRANHFTVFVNSMTKLTSITSVNDILRENGFKLNTAGGEIKGTPEELLEQSSTMANEVNIKFKQGKFVVLNSYYEFAKRYPMANGKLYQGFIAASADKIFESTNVIS